MKAAYLAYDQNAMVGLSVLSNYFQQIDFYLVDKEREPERIDFKSIAVLTDHLLIPAEEELRTATHLKVLKALNDDFSFYKKELCPHFQKSNATYTEIQKNCKTELGSLASIKDIVFNNKTNEIYIEREKTGVTGYDFLFVEDHQIISESLVGFGKNIYKASSQNSHVWFTTEFSYELRKPRTEDLGLRKFILVKDRLNKSVLDNWYFVQINKTKISVQQWVPFNQFRNSDFQKFIIERVEKILKEKLDLVQVTQFNQFFVNATSGFCQREGSLKNGKISNVLPSFHFWSQESINRYLYTKLDAKMKELNRMQQAALAVRG